MIKTAHKTDCERVFKNYDKTCPRCLELINGDKPRAGWNDLKIKQDAIRSKAISEHFRPEYPNGNKCGNIVCTCFEW